MTSFSSVSVYAHCTMHAINRRRLNVADIKIALRRQVVAYRVCTLQFPEI